MSEEALGMTQKRKEKVSMYYEKKGVPLG